MVIKRLFSSTATKSVLSDVLKNNPSYSAKVFDEIVSLQVNQVLEGFRVVHIEPVPDFDLVALCLEHEKTGAKFLHVARDDDNNVFSVAFPTFPKNSTGVAHILEHTTLCGSEKYPIRDPFFKMLNRSLATFMNAWTASDYTMYPFSSQNYMDYTNLRDVYMNAAFKPLLNELDFKQEGWRLEHSSVTDPKSGIIFKGVVYNEMKGALSDIESLFCERLQQHMFPGTCLAHNSGGDPEEITNLTHEDLVKFHSLHYHPSNAMFFTYGNFSLKSNLAYVDGALRERERKFIDASDGFDQFKLITSPTTILEDCPLDPMGDPEKQTKMIVSFLANEIHDALETFNMRILSYLLLDGPSSPMYKALIDSHIGSAYAPGSGYDSSTKIATFSCGLQGMKYEDVGRVEKIILNVLTTAESDDLSWMDRVDAAIHLIELGQKHKTPRFGLGLAQSLVPSWIRGCDPFQNMKINDIIKQFREEIKKDPRYLAKRIRKYCLDNNHRLTFIMRPAKDFQEKLGMKELVRLEQKVKSLNSSEKKQVFDEGLALLKKQEEKEDLSCLPCLKVSDIERYGKSFSLDHTVLGKYPTQWRISPTNGVSYFKGANSLRNLPHQLLPYLSIFTDALTELGVKDKSIDQFQKDIQLYTGGLSVSSLVVPNHSDLNQVDNSVLFSTHCLDRNITKAYELFGEALQKTNFSDLSRLKTTILANASSMKNSIVESGHSYATMYAASTLIPSQAVNEKLVGISQIAFMENLSKSDDMSSVIEKLMEVKEFAFDDSNGRLAVNCTNEAVSKVHQSSIGELLSSFAAPQIESAKSINESVFEPKSIKVFFPIPYPINFASKVVRTVPFTHPDNAKLNILALIIGRKFLHREIREKNGAYGGGCSFSGLDGLFSFYSYRDPNGLKSLQSFEDSVKWAIESDNISEQDLTEAKLSKFSSLDAPIAASGEGMSFFKYGITDSMRQVRREQLLDVTIPELKAVAYKYLLHGPESHQSSVVIGDASKPDQLAEYQARGFIVKAIHEAI